MVVALGPLGGVEFFYVWDNEIYEGLLRALEGAVPGRGGMRGVGRRRIMEVFSIKSSYTLVFGLLTPNVLLSNSEEMVFGNIWKSLTPSMVIAFSWKLLDHIPTKTNLARRNVLPHASLNCDFCGGGGEESSSHVFLHCDVVFNVWLKVF